MHESIRNQIGAEGHDTFAVDIERVFSVCFCSVGQHVKDCNIADDKKTAGGLNQKECGKKQEAAKKHQAVGQNAEQGP